MEAHFKSVKHGVLTGKKRLRPTDFLNRNLTYITGKLNEKSLPTDPKVPKNSVVMDDMNEV